MGVYSIDFSFAFFLVDVPPISLTPPVAELTLTSYLAFTSGVLLGKKWVAGAWISYRDV